MQNDYGNWCPEIYQSVFIDRFNDVQISVAPCCAATTQLENTADFNFETSPYLNKLREQFNRNEQPKECHQCWDIEAIGGKSRRLANLEYYKEYEGKSKEDVFLTGIDYSSTWACNLACVMCSPHYSSSWATELDVTKDNLVNMGRLYRSKNSIIDNLDLTKINRVHFNGGEPLINNDQTDLLLILEQAEVLKNVTISYNTNGTISPSSEVVRLWNKAARVILYFSIDAIGNAYEYIRYPGNWIQVSKNLLSMKQTLPPNVELGFNITVGSYNIFELLDLEHWILNNLATNNGGIDSVVSWQIAYNFDPKNLKGQAKLDAIEYLNPTIYFDKLKSYLNDNIMYRDDTWINKLDEIDTRRNTNWKNTLAVSKYY